MRKVTTWVIGSLVGLILIGYGVGVYYYQSHFLPNTVVAGVNLSGKTESEAEEALTSQENDTSLSLAENGQELATVNLAEAGFSPVIEPQLGQFLDQQSSWTWPVTLVEGVLAPSEVKQLALDWQVDEDTFQKYFASLPLDQTNRTASTNAQVVLNDETKAVEVVAEKQGNTVSAKSLADTLMAKAATGETTVDLKEAYEKPAVVSDSKEIQSAKAEIEKILNAKISMQIEDQEVEVPSETIASWISMDEAGEVQVDKDAIDAYLLDWNVNNAALNQKHEFQSTASGTVTVDPGIYGWYINREFATDELADIVLAGEDTVYQPSIGGEGYNTDSYFGNSYIEVDLTKQKIFVYVDGVQQIATDIVSGNIGTSTVPGAYAVWDKQTPSVLKGYNPRTEKNYEQPVEYWMPFDYTGQGVHDANWQSTFGGDVYLQRGSLGCINTPPAMMAQVFETAYVGMPVIVFQA
jgi:lipoprotein-anchoring transpeptidase ErfK/SrfK